jgi:hypothetical protein
MKATPQRTLSGPFETEDCGHGTWCLRQTRPPAAAVYVRAAAPPATLERCTALTIEWPGTGAAVLRFSFPAETIALAPASALVHEPHPQLYDALPLARFEAEAQRFWRLVFRVVRLPGGRFFVRLLARRTRRRG